MYSHYFGLTQDPFSIAPDPRYLFMSERHREALAHLLYGVAGLSGAAGGFVLLTGDIGTGKTTICRCFLEQLPAGCHVAYIFNPKLTVPELLQSICDEFHIVVTHTVAGLPTVKDYIDTLNAFLLQSHAAGQSCVLIIDEAQNLSADVLEQLRLLTNLETNERKLLQIVLIGQPELRSMLKRPALEQLAQRVIARFHLDALAKAETRQYIQHRLAVAGHTGVLPFDDAALQTIYQLARGVPRRINLLCGRALLGAWASGQNQVNRRIVRKSAMEVFGTEAAPARLALGRPMGYVLLTLGLIGGTLLTGLLVWRSPAQTTRLAVPMPVPVLAPPAPASASSKPVVALPATPAPIEELEDLLPRLSRDMNQAWRELGPLWQLPPAEDEPCPAVPAQALRCYQASHLTWPLIRQLGQPGILTLQDGATPPVYAVLTGVTHQTATLRMGTALHTVRLVSLGRLWRGDFATYWRAPPGYSADLRDGSSGPVIDQLAKQLTLLDGRPSTPSAPQTLDQALRDRVRAFQSAQGLKADGQPGPMTFMQLDSATGMTEPRLQTVTP